MSLHTTNGSWSRTDRLNGHADALRGQADASDVSRALNGTETTVVSHGDGAGTYLDTGGVKHDVEKTDGLGSHMDANRTANASDNVRILQKKPKLPDLPVEVARCAPDMSNSNGDIAEASSVHTDVDNWGGGHCGQATSSSCLCGLQMGVTIVHIRVVAHHRCR